ncbi:MAG: hypothetical protein IKU94_06680, partial [Bacteroidaceae bacterium]|nr:hypothetical protein [Bacteroidaceae bacterium]
MLFVSFPLFLIQTVNGDIDGNWMEEVDEDLGLHLQAEALIAPVDVDFVQLQDGGLDIDGHLLPRGEGGG